MSTPFIRMVATRLSVGQARLIRDLSTDPYVLGCAEVVAKPLAKPSRKGTRPALVVQSRDADNNPCFALNAMGVAVQAQLERMA